MDKTIIKITKIFTIIVMIGAGVMAALVIANSDPMKTSVALADKLLNPFFYTSYILLGIGILITLLFAVIQMLMTPKTAIRALVSIGLLGVLYLIAYLSASGNIDAPVYQEFSVSSGESRIIGSLIYLAYILGGLSVLAILYSAINSFLLKR